MNILCACEESQAVTKELRRLGHNAFSCDMIPESGGRPEWHIQGDAIPLINGNCTFWTNDGAIHVIDGRWDMLIAFPPCTYLTGAGNRHFSLRVTPPEKVVERMEKRETAAIFFMRFALADCPRIAIENPIGHMTRVYRKPDQIIQPYYFSSGPEDKENYQLKTTCLWLKNLPPLRYGTIPPKPQPIYQTERADGSKKNRYFTEAMPRNKERAKNRSKTFPGIARAMAEQWAGKVENE